MNAIAQSTPTVLQYIDDWSRFAKLTITCQSDILRKLDSVHQLIHAKRGQKGEISKALSESRHVSVSTLYNEKNEFERKGWRGLIDKRRFAKDSGLMPRLCKDAIKAEFENHQRTDDAAEVRRKFITKLQLWRRTGDYKHSIPGYTSPPEDDPKLGHPLGWSEKTFSRLKLDAYESALSKQGKKAATSFLPPVLTTRKGSHYLQRIYFDDQDYDNKIAVAGLSEAVRPVGFNCLDHHTAAHLGYHLRVVTKTTDEQTNKSLTGKEFTWFALHTLQTVGYRTDQHKTQLVFEHGTANSYNNKSLSTFGGHHSFEEALAAITNGQVTVSRSGKFNTPAFAGMLFRPSSTGNFKYKTWIESAFRLVRTYMQDLPGSVGRKYELAPEELHGIEHNERQLAKAIATMPPAVASKMNHSILTYVEFAEILSAVYRAINSRTDHNLEAWEECGFIRSIWRLSENSNNWLPRDELDGIEDQDEKTYLVNKVTKNSNLRGTETLSPAEALQKCSKDPAIKTLPREFTPLLIPKEWAVEKTVKSDRTIRLADPFHKKTTHHYITQLETSHGMLTMKPGTDILCYYNPFDIDNLVVCTTEGAYLGTLRRVIPRQLHDTNNTLEQLGERSRLRSDLDAAPRARAATIMQERQQNTELLRRAKAGEPVTEEEKRAAQTAKSNSTRRTNKVTKHARQRNSEQALESWADQPTNTEPKDDSNDSQNYNYF
ncbi:hypothetical protein [Rubritalea sp.]|uniref:hypothetical protein n=1 Tax=Rubritalea sp. TaxID=2109375 RepID=UPI003EF83B8B